MDGSLDRLYNEIQVIRQSKQGEGMSTLADTKGCYTKEDNF